MTTTSEEEQFVEFWVMPQDQLQRHIDLVSKIADLRRQFTHITITPPPARPKIATKHPSPAVNKLTPRAPMRPPKPGSLRDTIRQILNRNQSPMPRSEIIAEAAKLRNILVSDAFIAKVGETLNNRHDPIFERVSRGVYGLGKAETSDAH